MKNIWFITFTAFLFYGSSCEKMVEKKYIIKLDNKSSTRLYVAVGREAEGKAGIYPDTSLPASQPIFSTIAPNSTGYIIYGSQKIETIFDELPKDTLSAYLFNADSVDARGWSTIQSQYKVLTRYDLSLPYLKANNYLVTYPK